jgi:NTP pyrophosphatase (non-canonical NTP hydrolase)
MKSWKRNQRQARICLCQANLQSAKTILKETDARTLLEQLAEEAAELAQAAIKTIRAQGFNASPTPVGVDEAFTELQNEFLDVLLCYRLLMKKYENRGIGGAKNESLAAAKKLARWQERILSAKR